VFGCLLAVAPAVVVDQERPSGRGYVQVRMWSVLGFSVYIVGVQSSASVYVRQAHFGRYKMLVGLDGECLVRG